jgi:hypothetical protein
MESGNEKLRAEERPFDWNGRYLGSLVERPIAAQFHRVNSSTGWIKC